MGVIDRLGSKSFCPSQMMMIINLRQLEFSLTLKNIFQSVSIMCVVTSKFNLNKEDFLGRKKP